LIERNRRPIDTKERRCCSRRWLAPAYCRRFFAGSSRLSRSSRCLMPVPHVTSARSSAEHSNYCRKGLGSSITLTGGDSKTFSRRTRRPTLCELHVCAGRMLISCAARQGAARMRKILRAAVARIDRQRNPPQLCCGEAAAFRLRARFFFIPA
jgi:hypothetical protein